MPLKSIFYRCLFIADYHGDKAAETVVMAEGARVVSLENSAISGPHCSWVMFLDRGSELYVALMTLDSRTKSTAV
jgi:hypothetical protein